MYRVDEDGTIEMIRGDTAEFDITVTVEEEGQIVPYILQEGDILTFTVKKSTKVEEVLIQKFGEHITINPDDTESLKYGGYKYDVQLTFANGKVDTIIPPHNFILNEEVTW